MKTSLAFVLLTLATSLAFAGEAGTVESLKQQGELIVDDEFDRAELGEPWSVNDGRAFKAGAKKSQAQLEDGVLRIRKFGEAGHGASVRRPVAFADGVIEVTFRFVDGDGAFAVNLNDKEWGKRQKPKRYGHLGRVRVETDTVLIEDQKTPGLSPEFTKLKALGAEKEQRQAWKDTHTRKRFAAKVAPGTWHTLTVVNVGDVVRAYVDGQPAGEFRSEGFAHPTKGLLAFAVPDAVDVQRLRVWKLR